MGTSLLKDAAAFVVACLIGAGVAQYHFQAQFDPHIVWDGFNLPGFDAHVYVAMAEEPRVFTVAPWGYRILLPGLIGASLPPRWIVPGFEGAAQASLIAASGLLFLYLTVLGATHRASLLAVLTVMMTPPVRAVFENPFLVEPFALALLLLSLICIQIGAGPWVIALTLLLLSLSKEVWLFVLPLIFVRALTQGAKAAALRTVQVAAPAALLALLLRWTWAPQNAPLGGSPDYVGALGAIASSLPSVAGHFLLGGLSLVAVLALSRPSAREYLKNHALTLLALLALPLGAGAYTGEGAAPTFFAADVPRLLIYALPFAAALAVHLDPGHGRPRALALAPAFEPAAFVILLLGLAAPLGLDRYSRIDLSTSRDGPYVLGFARETLKTARRLERGETVVFDPEERKFAWGVSPAQELARLRFFLREGFGPLAHYGIHDIRMRDTNAVLVVPLLAPRPTRLTLTLDARESAWIKLEANGQAVGEALIGPQAVRASFEIPALSLFRGDNPISLVCDKAKTALPRILRLELSQASGS